MLLLNIHLWVFISICILSIWFTWLFNLFIQNFKLVFRLILPCILIVWITYWVLVGINYIFFVSWMLIFLSFSLFINSILVIVAHLTFSDNICHYKILWIILITIFHLINWALILNIYLQILVLLILIFVLFKHICIIEIHLLIILI